MCFHRVVSISGRDAKIGNADVSQRVKKIFFKVVSFKDSETGGIRPLIFTLIRVAFAQNVKETICIEIEATGGPVRSRPLNDNVK